MLAPTLFSVSENARYVSRFRIGFRFERGLLIPLRFYLFFPYAPAAAQAIAVEDVVWIRLFNVLYRKHKSWMRQQGVPPTWDKDKASHSCFIRSCFYVCRGGRIVMPPIRTSPRFRTLNSTDSSSTSVACSRFHTVALRHRAGKRGASLLCCAAALHHAPISCPSCQPNHISRRICPRAPLSKGNELLQIAWSLLSLAFSYFWQLLATCPQY